MRASLPQAPNGTRAAGGGLPPLPAKLNATFSSPETGKSAASSATAIRLSPWCKVAAGMAGGVAEALTLFPMDTIKTRLQMDTHGRYSGVADCARTIVRHEGGISRLYAGLTPFTSQLVMKYAYRFGSFTWFRRMLGSTAEHHCGSDFRAAHAATINFAAGLASGITEAVLVVNPFEVVKVRLQNDAPHTAARYRGPVHCAATIVREEGALALLKGITPTMIRQGSNQAFNFMVFSALNQHFWGKRDGDGKRLASWKVFTNGIIAGAVGPCFNAPMDVVKTRLMAQNNTAVGHGGPPQYQGFLDCTRTIARTEGVAALWKGLAPRLMRLAPGQAITWTVVMGLTGYFEERELAARAERESQIMGNSGPQLGPHILVATSQETI